ncbi:unnamed protein product [Spodoptera littoralis]|uniref:G-protein coupled receptors family 2 profile 2 domain-containing protein n=1 Tax=Spodoptera littoralis TaxID=7109 RepID=A0A9P0I1M0_SPOLI|nr:unnamed protein product [Spodoptera littoralis]CAH1638352.1 unnamed protein product [Spodoptera littoralis]
MLLLKILSFLSVLCISKCTDDLKEQCKDDYRDSKNIAIDIKKFCSDEWCIQKCCPLDSCFSPAGFCIKIQDLRKKISAKFENVFTSIQNDNITFYSNTEPRHEIKKPFKYIINHKNMTKCGDFKPFDSEYYFIQNASVKIYDPEYSKQWYNLTYLEYCVDNKLVLLRNGPTFILVIKEYFQFSEDNGLNDTLLFIGLLISSVFLLLVFIVHCMLKTLHSTFTGLLMMAYTITILLGFIVKVIMQATIGYMTPKSCKIITPFLYFLLMSSFFWLNAFSFCIWRGLRKFEVFRASRRQKLLSFMRYSLYAWGAPLVITGIVTFLDNIDIKKLKFIIKPPFDDCFKNKYGIQRYYFIPLGIIMFNNIVLFIMTIYHIMTTTNSTKSNAEFRRSGRGNSYKTYLKLSLTMGISWVLELIPNSDNTFLFILSNTYNSLIGVIIFFVYICDKNVLNELCKKFNIQNEFVIKLAHRKSLFRLARSMKANREELTSMQTTTTGLSSEVENKISLI